MVSAVEGERSLVVARVLRWTEDRPLMFIPLPLGMNTICVILDEINRLREARGLSKIHS